MTWILCSCKVKLPGFRFLRESHRGGRVVVDYPVVSFADIYEFVSGSLSRDFWLGVAVSEIVYQDGSRENSSAWTKAGVSHYLIIAGCPNQTCVWGPERGCFWCNGSVGFGCAPARDCQSCEIWKCAEEYYGLLNAGREIADW